MVKGASQNRVKLLLKEDMATELDMIFDFDARNREVVVFYLLKLAETRRRHRLRQRQGLCRRCRSREEP